MVTTAGLPLWLSEGDPGRRRTADGGRLLGEPGHDRALGPIAQPVIKGGNSLSAGRLTDIP